MAVQNAAHRAQDYFLYKSSTETTYMIVIFYCDVKYVYTDGSTVSRQQYAISYQEITTMIIFFLFFLIMISNSSSNIILLSDTTKKNNKQLQ